MFDFFKKKSMNNVEEIGSPIVGEAVLSSEISDPTFKEEMLGTGMAIKPEIGKVFAPADGTVALVFDTLHAISFVTNKGAEILIHVGLDTVKLEGKHFTSHVSSGDVVKKGDLLLEFDIEGIKADGYDTIVPIVICNTDDYKEVVSMVVGELYLKGGEWRFNPVGMGTGDDLEGLCIKYGVNVAG